jgi:hypothetical protein
VLEVFGGAGFDKVDGGAAEAAAGEAGAVATGEFLSDVDEGVEFRGAVSKIVAGAGVALKEILAELVDVALAQGAFAIGDAVILAHDVQGALVFALG